MSFFRTAFFVKNLTSLERALRIVAALAIVVAGLVWLRAPWSWVVAGSGAGFGFSGVVGFCPMCALAGRRLRKQA